MHRLQGRRRNTCQKSIKELWIPWTSEGALNRKKKPKSKTVDKFEPYAKVVIPYVPKLSECLAQKYRKYNIETIHKPTKKIKGIVCHKMKDKVHELDKTGVVYHTGCKKGCDHSRRYIGETSRVSRSRLYEHRVISHNEANHAQSLKEDRTEESKTTEKKATERKPSSITRSWMREDRILSLKAQQSCLHMWHKKHTDSMICFMR